MNKAIEILQNDSEVWTGILGSFSPSGKVNVELLETAVANHYFTSDQNVFINYNLIPVLNSFKQSELWRNLGYQLNKKLPCFLHIDTGMNRFGIPEGEINDLVQSTNELDVLCIMSHLSSSEEPDNEINKEIVTLLKHMNNIQIDNLFEKIDITKITKITYAIIGNYEGRNIIYVRNINSGSENISIDMFFILHQVHQEKIQILKIIYFHVQVLVKQYQQLK